MAAAGLSKRWLIMPAVALLYFAVLLVPHWLPRVAASPLFLFYILSVGAALALLSLVAVSCGLSSLWSKARGRRVPHVVRPLGTAALASLFCFAAVFLAARMVGRNLPTGSHLTKFDAGAWRDPSSADFVDGNTTPRQKMLGDVVARVLPGRNRSEIEAVLGHSLDTPYFRKSGRDLIYVLGPERDSFFGIDSEWLLIWLDESGRFKRYAVWTD